MKQLIIAIRVTIVLTLLTGVGYPLAVTALAKLLFPRQSSGSLISSGGTIIGSELIGQSFTQPRYFHGRPSATGDKPYDGMASGPSNLGPTNQALIDRVRADVRKFREENPTYSGPVPADIVTASGSGLDPDISPAAADAQVARVADARGMTVDAVRKLVAASTSDRQFGILGEPRVNVLKLNLSLDRR